MGSDEMGTMAEVTSTVQIAPPQDGGSGTWSVMIRKYGNTLLLYGTGMVSPAACQHRQHMLTREGAKGDAEIDVVFGEPLGRASRRGVGDRPPTFRNRPRRCTQRGIFARGVANHGE